MQKSNETAALFTEVALLIKKRMQHSLPLAFAQMQVLWFASQHKGAGMQDIAKYFKITAPSATFLVDELVRGKYLTRRPSTADRRKVVLALTPRGKQTAKALELKRKKVLGDIFKPLSAAERTALNRILRNIITNA